jgi:transcriptional/translational regulatory protein YebC/TACO1
MEEVLYEGYGPHAVAVIRRDHHRATAIEPPPSCGNCSKSMLVLGGTGCVAYMFQRKGLFVLSAENLSEEKLFEVELRRGLTTFSRSGRNLKCCASPSDFPR